MLGITFLTFELFIFSAICKPGCQHGGVCVNGNCSCQLGWTGKHCQEGIVLHICSMYSLIFTICTTVNIASVDFD